MRLQLRQLLGELNHRPERGALRHREVSVFRMVEVPEAMNAYKIKSIRLAAGRISIVVRM